MASTNPRGADRAKRVCLRRPAHERRGWCRSQTRPPRVRRPLESEKRRPTHLRSGQEVVRRSQGDARSMKRRIFDCFSHLSDTFFHLSVHFFHLSDCFWRKKKTFSPVSGCFSRFPGPPEVKPTPSAPSRRASAVLPGVFFIWKPLPVQTPSIFGHRVSSFRSNGCDNRRNNGRATTGPTSDGPGRGDMRDPPARHLLRRGG